MRKTPPNASAMTKNKIETLVDEARKMVIQGNSKQAAENLDSALELAEIYYGNDHFEVLRIRDGVADLMTRSGNYEDALEMYTGILQYASLNSKQKAFFDEVRKKEAMTVEKINKTSKDRYKQLKNKCTADYDLAIVNVQLQNYDKAKLCVLRALGATKMLYGINHRNIIKLRELLGDIHIKKEEYEEASEAFQSLLATLERRNLKHDRRYAEIQRKLEDIPSTFMATSASCSVIESVRSIKTSNGSTELATREKESSAFTAMIDLRIELGVGHLNKGNFDSAEDYFTNALEALLSIYGENYMEVSRVREYLGDVAVNTNKLNKAINSYEKALSIIEHISGKESNAYDKLSEKLKKYSRKKVDNVNITNNDIRKQVPVTGLNSLKKVESGKELTFSSDFLAELDSVMSKYK